MNQEAVVKNTDVKGKGCIGCQRHKKDIMVTMMVEPGEDNGIPGAVVEFHDYFLDQSQAEKLLVDLQERLNQNNEGKG